MKNILNLLLIPILYFSLATSCKKEDDLPKATQTGAGIFAARINGEVFNVKASLFSPESIFAGNYTGENARFLLEGRNFSADPSIHINITVKGNITPQKYELDGDHATGVLEYRYPNSIYSTNRSNRGEIIFTRVDHVNHIYSGTFEFNAINEEGIQKKITDGRFDVYR